MNWRWPATVLFFLSASPCVPPALSQTAEDTVYNDWVDYRNGEVSMIFDRIPVELAVEAIRARTGFHIVIPPAADPKFLSLRLNKLPLEPAMRSLLSIIGFKNFALVYDQEGRPRRAVVVGTGSDTASLDSAANTASKSGEAAGPGLTDEERQKILKQLERWSELSGEERGRIEDRLKNLPASENREQLVKEYGRQILGITK